MRTWRPLAVLGLVLLFAALAGGAATGSPPPTSLCGVCGEPDWNDEHPLDGYRAGVGSVTVDVFDNGTTRWTERVPLNDSGEAVLSNPEYRQRLVRESHEGHVVNDPETFGTAVENGTLVVRYRVDGASEGLGGIVLFEGFYDPGFYYRLDAERLTVRGPEGTTPVGDPRNAYVENGTVVYIDHSGGPSGRTMLAFDEGDGLVAQAKLSLTLALTLGPRMLGDAVTVTGVVLIAWTLAAVVLDRFVAPTRRTWRPLRLAAEDHPTRGNDGEGTIWWYLAGGFLSAAILPLLFRSVSMLVLLAVPAALLWTALGKARQPWQWWTALLGLLATPVAFVLPLTPLYGLGLGLTTLFVSVGGVAFLVVASVLFVLGRRSTRGGTAGG